MDMQSPMWSVWQVGTQSLSKLDLVGTLLVRGTGLCSSISSNRAADGGPLGALGLPDSNIVLRVLGNLAQPFVTTDYLFHNS